MIVVGEKLNSSIPKTLNAMQVWDEEYLTGLIQNQSNCGADYLDINTAICAELEQEILLKVISLVLKNSSCGIMIDSPSPSIIKEAGKICGEREIIVNSITLTQRINELLPFIRETNAGVVCLPIGKDGIPATANERVENSKILIERLTGFGIPEEKIYIDILAEALSVREKNALTAFDTLCGIKKISQKVKTICGLSNVSFGLPQRKNINTAFLAIALSLGLDCAILDITAKSIQDTLLAATALLGQDEYCMNYISHMR